MVRLLLGEIPLRSEFTAPGMTAALAPFYELAVAVRAGDTLAFAEVRSSHGLCDWDTPLPISSFVSRVSMEPCAGLLPLSRSDWCERRRVAVWVDLCTK